MIDISGIDGDTGPGGRGVNDIDTGRRSSTSAESMAIPGLQGPSCHQFCDEPGLAPV
ncbi:MAG: hypothetical protein OXL98_04825 [Acidimicrobiaceae bacterium]|nr:hypothetical protein [Acidimicrobiaceae bacterium]